MTTEVPPSAILAWVGLDWADRQHVGYLQPAGSDEGEAFVLEQKPEVVQAWIAQLRQRFPHGRVAISLEQSRGALLYALMSHDFLVLYPVAPKSLAKLREALCPSGRKDDPGDAELLPKMLRAHHGCLRGWAPDNPLTRLRRLLVEYRRKLVADQLRLTNRLTALLKQYFPQALQWTGELASARACEFLTRRPTLEAVQPAHPAELRRFCQIYDRRHQERLKPLLEEIRHAQPLTRDPAIIQATKRMAQIWAQQLYGLLTALEQIEQDIQECLTQHPDQELFESLPGAGATLAPRLLVALGSDRNRYHDASELQCFGGIAPVTERSGKSYWVHWRLACPKFLRQSFHEFAGQ